MSTPTSSSSETSTSTSSSGFRRASREEASSSSQTNRKSAGPGRRNKRQKLSFFAVTLASFIPIWTLFRHSVLSPSSLTVSETAGSVSDGTGVQRPWQSSVLQQNKEGGSKEGRSSSQDPRLATPDAETRNNLLQRLHVVMSSAATTIREEGDGAEQASIVKRTSARPEVGNTVAEAGTVEAWDSDGTPGQETEAGSTRTHTFERVLHSTMPLRSGHPSLGEQDGIHVGSWQGSRGSSKTRAGDKLELTDLELEDLKQQADQEQQRRRLVVMEGVEGKGDQGTVVQVTGDQGNVEQGHPRWSRRMMVLPYSEDYEPVDLKEHRESQAWADSESKQRKTQKRKRSGPREQDSSRLAGAPHHSMPSEKPEGEGANSRAAERDSNKRMLEEGLVIAVTPTYVRAYQALHMTNLVNALRAAQGPLVWIVVEAPFRTQETAELLRRTAGQCVQNADSTCRSIDYVHLETGKRESSLFNKGVVQRNSALEYIEQQRIRGTLYFMDDDNTYSPALFSEIRKVRRVGVFPVGFLFSEEQSLVHRRQHTGPLIERPLVREGERGVPEVFGWETFRRDSGRGVLGRDTPFCIDLAGFAFRSELLWEKFSEADAFPRHPLRFKSSWGRLVGSNFLERVVPGIDWLEPLANNCTEALVWHTHAEAEPRSPFPWRWRLLQPKTDLLIPVEQDRASWPYVVGGKQHGLKGEKDEPESLGYRAAECSSWSLCWIGLRFLR